MASSFDVCSFFFEPVFDPDAPPTAAASPPPPPSPSSAAQPKKRGRKKRASLSGGANRHRCKLCHNVYTQAANTGYTNLLTHLRLKHPDWEDIFKTQRLDGAAAASSATTDVIGESCFSSTTSSAISSVKSSKSAGRKRGPVYEHFEDVPASPNGSKQKKMRCLYCQEDTPQLSGRLKLHLSTKCPQAPEEVKTKYAGAGALMSNRSESGLPMVDIPIKSTPIPTPEKPMSTFQSPTTMFQPPASTIQSPTSTFKSPTIKLQPPPVVVATPSPAPKQVNSDSGSLRNFEEKLTSALIATNTPWSLLDNADFRAAMETLRPASGDFPLTAARARTEVLDRLTQKYDRNSRDVLATSNAITLAIKNTGGEGKETTYVALDEWRRAFVVAEGDSSSAVPYMAEVLTVLSTLPSTGSNSKLFLCAPTSGGLGRARQELQGKPFTLMGACMTQQTALLVHELVLCSLSLEEAVDNAVLIADALRVLPSLRQRVLRDIGGVNEETNTFAQVSVTSWRSVAMAVKQATRLDPFLRVAISQEKQMSQEKHAPASSSRILRQLVDMSSSDMNWNTLRHASQLLAPLHFVSALSEVQTTTSGQLLALWIWIFGAATRSPLLDGNSDALITSFMQRLECYVEEHFIACLILDPRVHGAGLSASGVRRARGVTVRVATALIPSFNENNFIRSYNDYIKKQGGFGEPGVWNAANTSSPMEFWGDYEGDPLHYQIATVAKIVCSFVPHTCSFEELWTAHAQRSSSPSKGVDGSAKREKCAKVRHGAVLNARADVKTVMNRYQTLLDVANEPSVEEMLQFNAATQVADEQDGNSLNLSVRSVLEGIDDGMEDDTSGSDAPTTPLDASWFDVSSAGLDKIRETMEKYLNAAIQQ